MFYGATAFNQDIGGWNVSSVTDMIGMFYEATAFNQYIGGWDVGSVTHMGDMFNGATSFNQDIGGWDVRNVKNMAYMFYGATNFDQNLSKWNPPLTREDFAATGMFNGAFLHGTDSIPVNGDWTSGSDNFKNSIDNIHMILMNFFSNGKSYTGPNDTGQYPKIN